MARHVPEPTCACGHGYGWHDGPARCGWQTDRDDPDTRCRCPKFLVPGSRTRSSVLPDLRPSRPRSQRGRHRRHWWR